MRKALQAALCVAVSCGQLSSGGLRLTVDATSATFALTVDGALWLTGGLSALPVAGRNASLLQVAPAAASAGADVWGSFERLTLSWGAAPGGDVLLTTSFRAYNGSRELLIFSQEWPRGFTGAAAGSTSAVVAPFPTLYTNATGAPPLNFLQWGGCQLANSYAGVWTGTAAPPAGDHVGLPLLLFDAAGRSVALGPAGNFFVAVHQGGPFSVGAGVKASVAALPPGFVHETLLVGGAGIGAAADALGGALLARSGKPRVNAYADFVLSHVGYWCDNGAYYYHQTPGFSSHQAALLAVQARARTLNVPLRYFQWDDWWMYQKGDLPGMVYWWPTPESIPAGMTDWLGAPTSLYNPGYSAQNVYLLAGKYKWATAGDLALPVDPAFFADIFKNASAARMAQFEQDFLCSYSWETDLTVRDVTTGAAWLRAMDDAAVAAGVSLQLCMMTPLHALASTQMRAATNGRGTSDNTHSVPADVLKMGHSGLLLRGLGMYVSRDNVYTSLAEPGCGFAGCTSADAVLQNVAALLGGGPYGVSDGVDYLNASLIARACRPDGVLLRADAPLATADAALLAAFSSPASARYVWYTSSALTGQPGLQYAYLLSLMLPAPLSVPLTSLGLPPGVEYRQWAPLDAADAGGLPVPDAVPAGGAATVPPSPPPPDAASVGGAYQVLSPVLPGGWCLLGEALKLVPASARRFANVTGGSGGGGGGGRMSAAVRAAHGEAVVLWVAPPAPAAPPVLTVHCPAGSCASVDCDVLLALECGDGACSCTLAQVAAAGAF